MMHGKANLGIVLTSIASSHQILAEPIRDRLGSAGGRSTIGTPTISSDSRLDIG